MRSLVEIVAPPRLGTPFRWLLGATWVSNIGDGFAIAAGPLLVASQTHDPFLVALAAFVQWAPPFVFGLWAGVLSDRMDRKLLVITVDLMRAVVVLVLVGTIVTETVSITVVLAALFLLGTAEVFVDNAAATLLPMIVRRDDLAIGNARIQVGFITINQLVGPPIGAALFAAGSAYPFIGQVAVIVLSAMLVSRMALPPHGRAGDEVRPVWHDMVEGVRWVVHHPAVRTLVLTIFTFNITFGAAWSVLVLYALRRLGLGEIGFGLLTTCGALGGLAGTLAYGWITARVSLGNLMRIGLVIETFTHLALALTTKPWVAMGIFFVFGAHAFVWGTTSITVRQRAVPTGLQGRVGSVNLMGTYGGLVLGSGIGGLLAREWGVTAPFWFAFAGSAVFVVLIWGQLRHIAHTDEAPLLEEPLNPSSSG
ncbi:MFS transporter [Nocardioides agariphilus]|jgi:predicted MFS family arabinose efflux permease|uniref:MFS transporter n=1 Tax=Nocardioides agariphilus TaxID=433664 RepID=A0A930VSK7_9ACTN|nr:MFS transporter [Nocardioides agariphilus]MBF4770228.1 MFS transporter [Nocardioides agariphilus]